MSCSINIPPIGNIKCSPHVEEARVFVLDGFLWVGRACLGEIIRADENWLVLRQANGKQVGYRISSPQKPLSRYPPSRHLSQK